MSKLREQFLVNDRLREYIERMLSVIIENNPQLLEVTINGSLPMGMSSYPSTNHQKQSSKETEKKSVPVQPLKPNESVKSNSSSVSTTTKQATDKNCRL